MGLLQIRLSIDLVRSAVCYERTASTLENRFTGGCGVPGDQLYNYIFCPSDRRVD